MQNTQPYFSQLDIKDAVTLLGDSETLASPESNSEFLFVTSRSELGTAQPHKLNYFGLAIAGSGRCTQIVNDHKVTLSPGTLLFTSPGDIISSQNCSSNLEIRQLLFTKSFLHNIAVPNHVLENLLWIDSSKPPIFQFDQDAFQKTKQLFEKIAEEASSSRAYHKQILRNGIVELLYRLNRKDKTCLKQSSQAKSQTNRLYQEFTRLVQDHFKSKKKVNDYAELLHVTPKYLSEVVKQESGRTALKYIHQHILQEAKNQLIHTNDSAKRIAYNLGYNTPSQFGRFFKRETDQSPIQFRNSRKTAH